MTPLKATISTPTYDITFKSTNKVHVFNKTNRQDYFGWVEISPKTGEYIAVATMYVPARHIQRALDELKRVKEE